MLYLKENKGITLTALVVSIIVIMILAGISITQGSNLIKTTKVENYVTNMITMRAKVKIYGEEINAETWDAENKSEERAKLYEEKYGMTKSSNQTELESKVDEKVNKGNGIECYNITKETLKKMGLDDITQDMNDGDYVVAFDAGDYKNLDIIYTPGIEYEKVTYYTLSKLQEKVEGK